jgi:hypothetical protein
MTEMLRYDPQKRPTAQQILHHPYFVGFVPTQRPITPQIIEPFMGGKLNLKDMDERNMSNNTGINKEDLSTNDVEKPTDTSFGKGNNHGRHLSEWHKNGNAKPEEESKGGNVTFGEKKAYNLFDHKKTIPNIPNMNKLNLGGNYNGSSNQITSLDYPGMHSNSKQSLPPIPSKQGLINPMANYGVHGGYNHNPYGGGGGGLNHLKKNDNDLYKFDNGGEAGKGLGPRKSPFDFGQNKNDKSNLGVPFKPTLGLQEDYTAQNNLYNFSNPKANLPQISNPLNKNMGMMPGKYGGVGLGDNYSKMGGNKGFGLKGLDDDNGIMGRHKF